MAVTVNQRAGGWSPATLCRLIVDPVGLGRLGLAPVRLGSLGRAPVWLGSLGRAPVRLGSLGGAPVRLGSLGGARAILGFEVRAPASLGSVLVCFACEIFCADVFIIFAAENIVCFLVFTSSAGFLCIIVIIIVEIRCVYHV